ncbi:MAG: flippase-like domain-containing protein [Planctomycetes bacterium]|nr:flippase-like domain-containing protein [Planctomycetota bacterium]
MPLPSKLGRRLLLGVLLLVGVYFAIAVWAGAAEVASTIARLPLWVVPAACALSFANYAVRFLKWQRYCHLLEIELAAGTSFLIYLSGMTLSVTPGKMGEVFKSWLVRQVTGVRIHQSAPIVVAERFTDLLGYLILVAIGGLNTAPQFAWIFWSMLAVCGVALVLVGSQGFARFVVRTIARLPTIGRLAPRVEGAFASTRILLAPREIVLPTLVSVVGWGCECTGFWLIANQVVPDSVPFLYAVFAFAFSAVAGAVAIIAPGGLLITEGILGTLLRPRYQPILERTLALSGDAAREAARVHAAASMMLARLCTLWFAVLVGFVATALFTRRFGQVDESGDDEAPSATHG